MVSDLFQLVDWKKRNRESLLAQGIIWLCVFLIPSVTGIIVSGKLSLAIPILRGNIWLSLPLFFTYCLNYFLLIPQLLFKGRKTWFFVTNIVFLLAMNMLLYFHPGKVPAEVIDNIGKEGVVWAMIGFVIMTIVLDWLCIAAAIGVRNGIRLHQTQENLKEVQHKATEAELNWLKYQLNPHFLFNTLNNISSLVHLDPDKAQDSIGQLSDLLRYELYESEQEKVPLSSEINFMKDYIGLMKLRCNSKTTVEEDLQCPEGDHKIAPLLFISLIENAFKHGTNVRDASTIRISQKMDGDDLVFACSNSFRPNQGTDHIGSGIGLENLRKRLELIYPGKYEYSHSSEDGIYTASVILKDFRNG